MARVDIARLDNAAPDRTVVSLSSSCAYRLQRVEPPSSQEKIEHAERQANQVRLSRFRQRRLQSHVVFACSQPFCRRSCALSGLAMSTLAKWSRVFQSRDVRYHVCSHPHYCRLVSEKLNPYVLRNRITKPKTDSHKIW